MIALTWILSIVGALGVGGTALAMIFFPTVAVPVIERIVQTLLGCKSCLVSMAFVGVALGSFWYGHHGEYKRGHDAAILAIAAEDEKAIARATEKRNVWRECKARSGTWDQSTGDCR